MNSKIIKILMIFSCVFVLLNYIIQIVRNTMNRQELQICAMLEAAKFNQLELMLELYHGDNGNFPPTRYQKEKELPEHSWRVILLPYSTSEWEQRYNSYDLSKDWNDPSNMRALGNAIPPYYVFDKSENCTQFLSFGNQDVWPGDKLLKAKIIKRGDKRFTILKDLNSDVFWTEPRF